MKIRQLEDELARAHAIEHVDTTKLNRVVDDGNEDIVRELLQASMMTESAMLLTPSDDDASNGLTVITYRKCFVFLLASVAPVNVNDEDDQIEADKHQSNGDQRTGALTNSCSRSVQTRIRLKDMRTMISVQDIHEGCVVLVNVTICR